MHAVNHDIPVKIVDLSSSGALFSLDSLGSEKRSLVANQRLELSLHHERAVFQVAARVVRTTHEFVAVEFLADAEAERRLREKLLSLQNKTL